jgi:hypothetical protein
MFLFSLVKERQESSRQRAELTRQCTERQKVKAMRQANPDLDNEDNEELLERPNTMVDVLENSFKIQKLIF